MDEEKIKCEFCENNTEVGEFHVLYTLVVTTDKQTQYMGLFKFSEGLADYLMDKNYHLSASQCILFRPDVVLEYVKLLYSGEEVKFLYLEKYITCLKCFEEFKVLMPLM